MKFLNKRFLFIVSILIFSSLLVACQSGANDEAEEESVNDTAKESETNTEKPEPTGIEPIVTMTMENGEEVTIELYPDIAPNTVNNFISLIESNFYDGVIFHRVIPGFMIQGGDPDGTGMGGPGYGIKGEFNNNDFENNLEHEAGVLSMARSQDPNSAGSQFFIMTEHSPHLDGEYAAFGKVVDGMDIVYEIVDSETDQNDKPLEEQVIESMTVDLKGYEAEEPEKQ